MTYIIVWIICGAICAMIAGAKGRSGAAFFLLGLLLGPIGVLLAFCTPANQVAVEHNRLSTGAERKCPYCAELVKTEAIRCKHCSADLEPIPEPAVATPVKPSDPFDTSQFTNKCKKCGASYPYKDKKCPDCGTSRG